MIEKLWSFALLLTTCLFHPSQTAAQPSGITARMFFPPRNYEIALGDSITPNVRDWNRDTVSHAGDTIQYRITNVLTGLAIYSRAITLPKLLPGDSLDTTFAPYYSNPSLLPELGTFNGCLIVGSDTICARLFGVRRTSVPFRDPGNNYGKTATGDIPDQTLWTSVGATVVDGEDSTWDPPPPRYSFPGVGPDTILSPVIRLDRKDVSGNYYAGSGVGDTLASFPINMHGKTRMTLHFDYMRAGRHHYPLRWDDSVMIGPESTILDSAGNVIRPGDSLILEFKKPSAPAVNPSANEWNEIAAIDGGHDFEFKSFFARPVDSGWQITIDGKTSFLPDTSNYFTTDFRFRFRLKAKNDAGQSPLPVDDADQWYIDNPTLELPLLPELEVRWVRVVNPYTKVPQSQAVFPVFVKVLNYGSDNGVGFPIRVKIFDPNDRIVYNHEIVTDQAFEGQDTLLQFPDWDATNQDFLNGSAYLVTASLDQPGYDDYSDDDSTYTKFFLNVDASASAIQEFAYDDAGLEPGRDTGNDIPNLTHIWFEGIGFRDTSGSFAMKFQLAQRDTLYGARVYFANSNASSDYVRISVLNGDSNSCTPLDTVVQNGVASTMDAQIGGEDFEQFWPYFFPKPIVLERGTYWIAVSQLGLTPMEMGGDISRGGGEIIRANQTTPKISAIYGTSTPGAPWYGTQWSSGPGDNNGDVSCSFAIEMPAGSGNWKPMMPNSGLWPTMDSSNPLNWHFLPDFDTMPWTGAGTYLPMIRPMIAQFTSPPFGVSATSAGPVLSIASNYPNPFDPNETSTTISFTLPTQAPVSLTICNILGEIVKTLGNAVMPAGTHSVSWNGRDKDGAVVPAGVYLVSLQSAEGHAAAKLIVAE